MQRLRAGRRDWLRPAPSLWSPPGLKHAFGKRVGGEGTRTAEATEECDLLVGFSRLHGRPDPLGHLSSSPGNASFPKGRVLPPQGEGCCYGRTRGPRSGRQQAQERTVARDGAGLARGHWKPSHKPAAVFDRHLEGSGYTSASVGPSLGRQLDPRTPGAPLSPESHLPPDPVATLGAAENHYPGSAEKMIFCAFLFRH